MNPTKRILVNTVAQYIRTVLNVVISLYATRLVLTALGKSDFGLYSLVTSVVAMLMFITDALMITTQRHICHARGRGDSVGSYVVNSVLLHLIIGVVVCGVMMIIEPWVTGSLMKIPEGRDQAATVVYWLAAGMLLTTFLTAPFRAMLVARENIVYVSIIDVLDAILKLLGALWLGYAETDRLVMYGVVMTGVFIFRFLAFGIYCVVCYEEFRHLFRYRIGKRYMAELTGFAGWTVYGTACIVLRSQGLAIVMNRAFSTVVNAAYGIAQQVMGATYFVAQSIMNAMNPQIVRAEGAGDRGRMINLVLAACKYEFLLMSVVTIPLVAEMPAILELWLGDVPEYCVVICRLVLIALCLDQLTVGFNSAIQAVGKIGWFTVTINTVKVLTIPLAVLVVRRGGDVGMVMWLYVIIEIVCLILRVPFAVRLAGLRIVEYVGKVLMPVVLPIGSAIGVCMIVCSAFDWQYRLLFTGAVSVVVEMLVIWLTAVTEEERKMMINSIR